MGEGIDSIERRAALREAAKRMGPLRDKFARTVVEGDGVLLAQTQPMEVIWRITDITPCTQRDIPPGHVWATVVATTRVLCPERLPSDNMVLVVPVQMEPDNTAKREQNPPPAPGVTPSGLIIPPQDK